MHVFKRIWYHYCALSVSQIAHQLQKKGTKAAKRRLRQLAGQEQRFAKDINHTISKRLVETAQRTKRAIALEDLTGIRTRVRVRKPQRARQQSSSFYQLRSFISYKAQRAGVRVVLVDPRNTSSRTCPACGHLAKEKRPSQSRFCCVSCGCAAHADTIAAQNIRVLGRAVVSLPYVSYQIRLKDVHLLNARKQNEGKTLCAISRCRAK